MPVKYGPDGAIEIPSVPREHRVFDGVNYIMEEGAKVARLFPSDLDQNEDGIFQFGKTFVDS